MRLFRRAAIDRSNTSPWMDRGGKCWLARFRPGVSTGLPIFSIQPLIQEAYANPTGQVWTLPDKVSADEMKTHKDVDQPHGRPVRRLKVK
jgi:hypothetical protein